jgi:hypothetical protein
VPGGIASGPHPRPATTPRGFPVPGPSEGEGAGGEGRTADTAVWCVNAGRELTHPAVSGLPFRSVPGGERGAVGRRDRGDRAVWSGPIPCLPRPATVQGVRLQGI